MHREIQGQIEKILACKFPPDGVASDGFASDNVSRSVSEHLEQCAECRQEVAAMQRHSGLMQELRAPAGQVPEPRPGFYARVMERIEAEGPASIWNLFMESAFGRRIAVASVALALVLGVFLVSSERTEEPMVAEQGASQSVQSSQDMAAQNVSAQQGAINDALPASATEFGPGIATRGIAPGDISAQMLMQQQMLMEQMINQMDDAASQDQVLVNLATYQEQ
jgi:anti-sigma factor RsiW